jgi:hypothetical protein
MIEILLLIIINAIVCNGVWLAMQEGQALYFITKIALRCPTWLYKPLAGCITCMASIHSLYVFFPLAIFFEIPLWTWFIHVPATAYLNTLFYDWLNYEEDLEDGTTSN